MGFFVKANSIICIPDKYTLPFSQPNYGATFVSKKTNTLPNLEVSLAEISQLVDKMEQGDLTLEQSLTYFERGITLVKHCQKILEEAEQKVQILIQHNNQEELSNYANNAEDAGDNADSQ